MTTTNLRSRIGGALAITLVAGGLVATTAAGAAVADDGSTPSPSPSSSSSPSGGVSGSPSGSPSPEPSPTTDPVPAAVPAPPAAPAPAPAPTRTGPVVAGHYTPPDGTLFNYPYGKKRYKNTIRTHVARTIKAVPTGGRIRIAAYSINDSYTVDQLLKAKRRGVSVQVIVNSHNLHGTKNHASSPSFIRLRKKLGSRTTRPGWNPDNVSFAKICRNIL